MNNFKKDDTLKMRLLCTVLFLSFTFVYLYFYQADILAVAQHVISNGTTHYNRTIGAVIITVTLWLIPDCEDVHMSSLLCRRYCF